jgi:hypothetical protein
MKLDFFVINEYANVPSFKNIFDIYCVFVYVNKFLFVVVFKHVRIANAFY